MSERMIGMSERSERMTGMVIGTTAPAGVTR